MGILLSAVTDFNSFYIFILPSLIIPCIWSMHWKGYRDIIHTLFTSLFGILLSLPSVFLWVISGGIRSLILGSTRALMCIYLRVSQGIRNI
jgi:hypothetical protein